MKKSDLFDLALKLFAVYLLIQSLMACKDVVMFLQFRLWNSPGSGDLFFMFLAYAVNVAVPLLAGLFLFRNSETLTGKLIKQEDEAAPVLKIDRAFAFQLACVVIGGFMIADSIRALGFQAIGFASLINNNFEPRGGEIPQMIWEAVFAIAGYALITASGSIAGYFTRKTAGQSTPAE